MPLHFWSPETSHLSKLKASQPSAGCMQEFDLENSLGIFECSWLWLPTLFVCSQPLCFFFELEFWKDCAKQGPPPKNTSAKQRLAVQITTVRHAQQRLAAWITTVRDSCRDIEIGWISLIEKVGGEIWRRSPFFLRVESLRGKQRGIRRGNLGSTAYAR